MRRPKVLSTIFSFSFYINEMLVFSKTSAAFIFVMRNFLLCEKRSGTPRCSEVFRVEISTVTAEKSFGIHKKFFKNECIESGVPCDLFFVFLLSFLLSSYDIFIENFTCFHEF